MDKSDFFNRIAKAYKNDGIPPFADKVIGLFYISYQKYFYFHNILHELKSMKGALNNTLKHLVDFNRKNYFSSENKSSKRLFSEDVKRMKLFLHSLLLNHKKQDQLLIECVQLRINENEGLNDFNGDSLIFNKDSLVFMDEKTELYFK